MTARRDSLGDLLRDFYRLYGVGGEGPPLDLDVSALLGALSGGDAMGLESDIDLLNRMVADKNLPTLVRECDALLEEIANQARQTALLEEIDQHYENMSVEPDAVFHGIL